MSIGTRSYWQRDAFRFIKERQKSDFPTRRFANLGENEKPKIVMILPKETHDFPISTTR